MLNLITYCIPFCSKLQDPDNTQRNCCRAGATHISSIPTVSQDIWGAESSMSEVVPGSYPRPWKASDTAPVPNPFLHGASMGDLCDPNRARPCHNTARCSSAESPSLTSQAERA